MIILIRTFLFLFCILCIIFVGKCPPPPPPPPKKQASDQPAHFCSLARAFTAPTINMISKEYKGSRPLALLDSQKDMTLRL